jgi:hypothetical protein
MNRIKTVTNRPIVGPFDQVRYRSRGELLAKRGEKKTIFAGEMSPNKPRARNRLRSPRDTSPPHHRLIIQKRENSHIVSLDRFLFPLSRVSVSILVAWVLGRAAGTNPALSSRGRKSVRNRSIGQQ